MLPVLGDMASLPRTVPHDRGPGRAGRSGDGGKPPQRTGPGAGQGAASRRADTRKPV